MGKKMWYGCLAAAIASAATYVAANYVSQNPESRFSQVAAIACRAGLTLSPIPVLQSLCTEVACQTGRAAADESRGDTRASHCCASEKTPAVRGNCPASSEKLAAAPALGEPAAAGVTEVLGAIIVPELTPLSNDNDDREDYRIIFEGRVTRDEEKRPPAVMPYIEDAPETACVGEFLSECWEGLRSSVAGRLTELWSYDPGRTSRRDCSPASSCDSSETQGARTACRANPVGAAEPSESTAGPLKSSRPKAGGVNAPARHVVDTLEFRPSDGRKGEFDPQPW